MPRSATDPLLSFARALLGVLLAILIAAMVLVAIGVGAVLTVQRGEIVARVAEADLPPGTYWGVVASLVAIVAILYLTLRFVSLLRVIVVSVDDGDPFVAQNAARLARMAWLALAVHVITIPIAAWSARLATLTEVRYVEYRGSGGGLALVLTLFVLARVFRKGAEMREELEGTV